MTCYGDMWLARLRRTKATSLIFDGLAQYEDEYGCYDPVDLCPSLDAVVENKVKLNTMVKDYALQVIVGVKKAEDHDAFVSEWLAEGGQAMKDAYNGWYQSK